MTNAGKGFDNGAKTETSSTVARKRWVSPAIIVSAVASVTQAKTSSGFGFETHSPGSLNGS
ncbi:MAG TPA: hypothetical protein VG387_21180 [Rhizomicrobium sp.]|jgi:hypothetical protein|nr:hypothetical protein [Rhizomicrobium sp.]